MSQASRVKEAIQIIEDLYGMIDAIDRDKDREFVLSMSAKAEEYGEDLYVSNAVWDWLVDLEERYL